MKVNWEEIDATVLHMDFKSWYLCCSKGSSSEQFLVGKIQCRGIELVIYMDSNGLSGWDSYEDFVDNFDVLKKVESFDVKFA